MLNPLTPGNDRIIAWHLAFACLRGDIMFVNQICKLYNAQFLFWE